MADKPIDKVDILDDESNRVLPIQLRERKITPQQMRTFEGYVAEIFSAFGLNLNTPGTAETPRRFIQALYDITDGYDGDPKLLTVFDTECRGGPDCHTSQVIEGPIQFYSLCEHHVLPIIGQAWVGYIAHEEIIGISKLTRLVRLFAKRFTVQERMGQQIADTLQVMLNPHGAAVYIEAKHLCTQMRGVRETAPLTRTTFWRGLYDSEPSLRADFFVACGLERPPSA